MRPFSAIASAFLICAVLATMSPAQEDKGASVKSVQHLNRAPINKEVLQVKLPRPTETKLSNGLTVLLLERHKLPTINVSLWINAGSLYDPKDAPGLAKFTADMLREGTTHRTSAQLSSEVDELGATLTAHTDFGSTSTPVAASGLADSAEKLLGLLADAVQNPAFAAEELDKYKKRALSELEQERSDPDFLAQEQMYRALYGTFPAAITSPTAASIQGLTADELRKFHNQYYQPGNALLGVVGDFDAKQMMALLEKYLGLERPAVYSTKDRGFAGAGTIQNLSCRSSRLGADQHSRRGTHCAAEQSGLYPAARDEPRTRRRIDRTAVSESARGEGLHLRGVQLHRGGHLSTPSSRQHRGPNSGDRWVNA
jgi:hypothetical protein